MKNKMSFYYLVVIFIFVSCQKDNNTNNENDSPFTGIVITDLNGNFIDIQGNEDGDWTYNDQFDENINNLFNNVFDTIDNYLYNFSFCPRDTTYITNLEVIGFPNPTESVIHIVVNSPYDSGNCLIKCILLDQNYTKLLEFQREFGLGILNFQIALNEIPDVKYNQLYRLYYKIISLQYNEIKMGHGDVVIQN